MPGGVVTQAQFLRGFEDWFADLIADPTFYHALLERITDLWIEMAKDELDAAGDSVDFCFFGDDVAFQDGPMMSMELYRKMVKPYHARVFSYIKSRSSAKILYHTCGSVAHLIPDLIELGVDALNPIQVSAKGMDTKTLKREFGKDICFWGGIDTQRVLPFGSPADVAGRGRSGGSRTWGRAAAMSCAPCTTSRPTSRPRTSAPCTTPPGNTGRRPTRGPEPGSPANHPSREFLCVLCFLWPLGISLATSVKSAQSVVSWIPRRLGGSRSSGSGGSSARR